MATSATTLLVVTSLAILLKTTSAYPTGAPPSVCGSMLPGHNFTAQSSVAPYNIVVDSKCYTAEKQIKVTLRSSGSSPFEGFFMQARKPNDNSNSFGTFSPAGNPIIKSIDCFGLPNNAITHNTDAYVNQTSFTWTPPATSNLTGNIVLTATVVEDSDIYWVQAVKLTLPECNSSSSESLSSGAYSLASLLTISILLVARSMGAF